MADPGRIAPELRLCRGCRQYVWRQEQACPFCSADVAALEADYEVRQAAVREAADALQAALDWVKGRRA